MTLGSKIIFKAQIMYILVFLYNKMEGRNAVFLSLRALLIHLEKIRLNTINRDPVT